LSQWFILGTEAAILINMAIYRNRVERLDEICINIDLIGDVRINIGSMHDECKALAERRWKAVKEQALSVAKSGNK
jgi:hypothetical protein